ncbi:MAG: hypothetical protein AB7O73_01020 [Bacteroidia bacterium]
MRRAIKYSICILSIMLSITIAAQGNKSIKEIKKLAEEKFKNENYEDAIEFYLQLITDEPKNIEYNYNLAVCYLNSNIKKSKAIPHLEIVTIEQKDNSLAYFLLGRAYQFSNRFDDALQAFKSFKNIVKSGHELSDEADLEIQHCLNGKELTKFPINVNFRNLGPSINSAFADYYPFVNENEGYMVFNSKRPINKDAERLLNGQYMNSIYLSKVVNGEYMESEVIGAPICKGNSGEEVIGMNAKGDILIILKNNLKGKSKLYLSRMDNNGQFGKLEALDDKINGNGDVISACINNDASVIYFASNAKGGFGGTDLYSCKKLPNGKWSDAMNMGADINTKYDEDFPNLSPDGNTFYFSSKGSSSMGGYDIFKAKIDEETGKFSKPLNMGYPLNTSYDDFNFRISKNGKYGYVASLRGGGLGDYDIYRVTFNEIENDYTILIGNILPKDSTQLIEFRETYLTVYNNISNEIVGNYVPNPEIGRFIIILPPGKYTLICEAPGFKEYKRALQVYDKASYQKEINLYIELKTEQ